MDLRETRRAERLENLLWGAALALYAGFLLATALSRGEFARDAWIGFGICRQLMEGTTEGRQALVSSIWWPPFPSLLRLPFVWLSGAITVSVALLAVGVLGATCVPLVVERALRRWGADRSRYLLAALAAADPDLVRWAMGGAAAPIVVAAALATLYGITRWVSTRGTGALAYAAIGSAVMVGMGAEAILWVAALMLFLLTDICFRPAARGQRQAIIVMTMVPVLYGAGLWILMNWLIMGDGLYFLRSVRAGLKPVAEIGAFSARHGVAVGILCLVAFGGIVKRDRGTAVAGAAGLAFAAAAMFLAVRGFLWDPVLAALALGPAAALGAGYLGATGRARWILSPLLAILVAGMVLMGWFDASGARRVGADSEEQTLQLVRRMEMYLLGQSRYPKVFVCGYDAFELAGAGESRMFVPCLDFDMSAARRDYHGHKLYLLVHRPEGMSKMDSIHWKYEDVYALGIRETLYDSDWGHWRLFEIVEAPIRRGTRAESGGRGNDE